MCLIPGNRFLCAGAAATAQIWLLILASFIACIPQRKMRSCFLCNQDGQFCLNPIFAPHLVGNPICPNCKFPNRQQVSLLRKTDPEKAYMNCHTDITLPYDELAEISVIRADGRHAVSRYHRYFIVNSKFFQNLRCLAHHRQIGITPHYIAGAGGAAHLPGMAAAIFPMPVIGVPIHTKSKKGYKKKLSSMPKNFIL